ncbi:MAG TPA: methyl-accepting chemotaxis protein [Alphaproteobacteria bacterium]|nr:methyl-accepting chemotaxis protein [Alphaproteobacteria bacterium]
MSFFANLAIRTKVIAAFVAVLVATAGLGLFALDRLHAVNDNAAGILINYLPAIRDLGKVSGLTEQYRARTLLPLLATTPDDETAAEAGANDIKTQRDKLWKALAQSVNSADEKTMTDQIEKSWEGYGAVYDKALAALRQNHRDEAMALLNKEGVQAMTAVRGTTEKLIAYETDHAFDQGYAGVDIYDSSVVWIYGAFGVSALLSLIAGLSLVLGVSRPIRKMTDAMDRLAKRDLETEITGIGRKDEIGHMAEAVQVFKQGLIDAENLAQQREADRTEKERRQKLIDEYVGNFDQTVRETLDMLASASTEMNSTASSMSAIAEETGRQATAVAVASEQASANVSTVASASEEMAGAISEIARQVQQSTDIARNAVVEASNANATMQGLADAAQRVGEVVALINDIASQTNLLALNATIEAARAGEAGKGFAVVASEVKALANQTGKATEEISGQVTAIQSAAKHAVDAIKGIDATITRISEISAIIASAVEEQGAATREISRNTQEAASGTQEVNRNISGVNDAAAQTGSAATQVLAASAELGRQAEQLRAEVDRFLSDLKAA